MTRRQIFFRNIMLTATLSGALMACGGDRPLKQGVYKGHGGEDRTASHGAAVSTHTAPLAERVAKLEQDVSLIRNDMGQLAMTYNGLMTTNERIDSLLAHLEAQQPSASTPAVEKAPVKITPAPKPEEKPAVKSSPGGATVVGVRIGEHPGITRLVIDWSALGDVKTELDNTEKLLLVTLSKTAWDAKTLVSGLSSPLVAGWSVDENGGGKILAIQLKKSVSVKNVSKLEADDGKSARVVIDLAAS